MILEGSLHLKYPEGLLLKCFGEFFIAVEKEVTIVWKLPWIPPINAFR